MVSSEIFINIGLNIRKLRREKNLTQQDLAAACNFEKSNLARIEAGRTNPTVLTLFKICEVLRVPLKRLFEFDEYPLDK